MSDQKATTTQSNVIPFFAEPKRERACSFCKRKESEVAKMVSVSQCDAEEFSRLYGKKDDEHG
jgi:hypothetical protein